jgi:hypothetical protein
MYKGIPIIKINGYSNKLLNSVETWDSLEINHQLFAIINKLNVLFYLRDTIY